MKTSNAGLILIKEFEGLHLKAYRCPAGVATIGWGHTKNVKMGMTITTDQAEQYLKADVVECEKAVMKWFNYYHWTQNEFDALVSFLFNLGPGKMKALVQDGTCLKSQISNRILLYDKATINGKKVALAGLTRRRKAEKSLFDGKATNNSTSNKPLLKMGSRGAEVKRAQTLLKNAGYDCGAADGIFGKKTDTAVRLFQADHINECKLIDGIIGEKTWTILEKTKK